VIRVLTIALLGTIGVVSILIALPAFADAPAQQGWWTATNPGTVPGLGIGFPAAVAPPDVPSNGLLVEGGATASSPVAYAGLIYQVPVGSAVGALTLDVASVSATTPDGTLELCPLVEPTLVPDQGGAMSDAPAYNCSKSVTGNPASSGASYGFNVSPLVADGVLAVAILPTSAAERVVFDPPEAGSLATSTPVVTVPSGSTGNSGGVVPAPATTTIPTVSEPPPATIPPQTALPAPAPAPAVSPTSSAKSTPPATTAAAAPFSSSEPASLGGGPIRPVALALVILGLLGAGMLWASAGNRAIKRADLRRAQS
jgi:hypothetical protein